MKKAKCFRFGVLVGRVKLDFGLTRPNRKKTQSLSHLFFLNRVRFFKIIRIFIWNMLKEFNSLLEVKTLRATRTGRNAWDYEGVSGLELKRLEHMSFVSS